MHLVLSICNLDSVAKLEYYKCVKEGSNHFLCDFAGLSPLGSVVAVYSAAVY